MNLSNEFLIVCIILLVAGRYISFVIYFFFKFICELFCQWNDYKLWFPKKYTIRDFLKDVSLDTSYLCVSDFQWVPGLNIIISIGASICLILVAILKLFALVIKFVILVFFIVYTPIEIIFSYCNKKLNIWNTIKIFYGRIYNFYKQIEDFILNIRIG